MEAAATIAYPKGWENRKLNVWLRPFPDDGVTETALGATGVEDCETVQEPICCQDEARPLPPVNCTQTVRVPANTD